MDAYQPNKGVKGIVTRRELKTRLKVLWIRPHWGEGIACVTVGDTGKCVDQVNLHCRITARRISDFI